MEEWKFYSILLGVAAALIGIYFREALKKAHIQKNASSRLIAYLDYWNQNILEWDLFSIVYIGEQWRKEKVKAYSKSRDVEDILSVNKEYEDKLKELREMIRNKDPELQFDEKSISEKLKKLSPKLLEQFLDAQKVNRQNIIEGKIFISDEEAATLGSSVANKAINIKLRLISLVEHAISLLIQLSEDSDKLEISNYADELYQCLRCGIIMYQDFDPLQAEARKINQKPIFNLALKNMLTGL